MALVNAQKKPFITGYLPLVLICQFAKFGIFWKRLLNEMKKKTILSCELSYQNILSYISLDEPETRRVMLYEVSIWAAGANDRNLSYAVAHTENKYRQNIQNICKANKQTNILKNIFECKYNNVKVPTSASNKKNNIKKVIA